MTLGLPVMLDNQGSQEPRELRVPKVHKVRSGQQGRLVSRVFRDFKEHRVMPAALEALVPRG